MCRWSTGVRRRRCGRDHVGRGFTTVATVVRGGTDYATFDWTRPGRPGPRQRGRRSGRRACRRRLDARRHDPDGGTVGVTQRRRVGRRALLRGAPSAADGRPSPGDAAERRAALRCRPWMTARWHRRSTAEACRSTRGPPTSVRLVDEARAAIDAAETTEAIRHVAASVSGKKSALAEAVAGARGRWTPTSRKELGRQLHEARTTVEALLEARRTEIRVRRARPPRWPHRGST